jgi:hypothetical protein
MRYRHAIPAAIGALLISTAWAATVTTTSFDNPNAAPSGAHYNNTGPGEPSCSVSGFTVTCDGTVISGIGNLDATVRVSVAYSGTVTCTNKGGNLVEVKTTSQSTSVLPNNVTTVKNGSMTVAQVSFGGDPATALKANAACPNGNWTKSVSGTPTLVSFSYSLTFDGFADPAITITGP